MHRTFPKPLLPPQECSREELYKYIDQSITRAEELDPILHCFTSNGEEASASPSYKNPSHSPVIPDPDGESSLTTSNPIPSSLTVIPDPDRESRKPPTPIDRERIYREAETLLNKYPDPKHRPPLFGLLTGVKDLYNVDGMSCQAGSRLPASVFAGKEGFLIRKLKAMGCIVLAKTVSTEFAYFQPGQTVNPYNPFHTPGGSSSGSAVAVAAGIVSLATGTQTIASVTRPASYCGVVGYKPTFGILPMDGIFPFAPSLDHPGFFTQDYESMCLLANVLIPEFPTQARKGKTVPSTDYHKSSKPVLGIPSEAFLSQADSTMRSHFLALIKSLERSGFQIQTTPLFEEIQTINSIHLDLAAYEFHLSHQKLFPEYHDLYSVATRDLFLKGEKMDPRIRDLAHQTRHKQLQSIKQATKKHKIDYWLSPAATSAAPRGLESTGSPLMSLPWTFTGLPTFSLPSGFTDDGLPLGLQICAAPGQDGRLFHLDPEILHLLNQGLSE